MNNREDNHDDRLVPVFRAADEFVANIVLGLLVGENIPAMLESKQVPMYDGIMKMGEGYWGDVVVPEGYAERSRRIIEAYHTSVKEEDQTAE